MRETEGQRLVGPTEAQVPADLSQDRWARPRCLVLFLRLSPTQVRRGTAHVGLREVGWGRCTLTSGALP